VSEEAVGKQSAQELVETISAGQLQNVTLDVRAAAGPGMYPLRAH
jgi:hypothetical protein